MIVMDRLGNTNTGDGACLLTPFHDQALWTLIAATGYLCLTVTMIL